MKCPAGGTLAADVPFLSRMSYRILSIKLPGRLSASLGTNVGVSGDLHK